MEMHHFYWENCLMNSPFSSSQTVRFPEGTTFKVRTPQHSKQVPPSLASCRCASGILPPPMGLQPCRRKGGCNASNVGIAMPCLPSPCHRHFYGRCVHHRKLGLCTLWSFNTTIENCYLWIFLVDFPIRNRDCP